MIETHPSVTDVYLQHGQKFGSALDKTDVKQRFKAARRKLFAVETSANDQIEGELVSSDVIERDLWRGFIDFVFDDVADSDGLFGELWDFFAVAENWRVYADVAECLSQLKQQGHYLAIASNFDSRLIPIVDDFEELSALDDVFCSASLGFRKPDPAFYRQVLQKVGLTLGTKLTGDDIIFVGDCVENDFHGPRRMGWSAFWLDRRDRGSEPNGDRNCPESCRIVSLNQLPPVLE